jgi:hypothetical protein
MKHTPIKTISPAAPAAPASPEKQLGQIPTATLLPTRCFTLAVPVTITGEQWANLWKFCKLKHLSLAEAISDLLSGHHTTFSVAGFVKQWVVIAEREASKKGRLRV